LDKWFSEPAILIFIVVGFTHWKWTL